MLTTVSKHLGEPEMQFTAVYRKVPEGYICFVEELPGANSQAPTLNDAIGNIAVAVELVLDANRALSHVAITER
jgi:predicted RNase H-like HicB family nuclease